MTADQHFSTGSLSVRWRVPVMVMVLAGIVIPVEVRPLGSEPFTLSIGLSDIPDVLANILGFVPVGMALGQLGLVRAVVAAGLISMAAELSQLIIMHRAPDLTDIVTNIIGSALGAVITRRWRISHAALEMNRTRALAAAALALVMLIGMWATSGTPLNPRGKTAPGILEAHWKFDEPGGSLVTDASGHGWHGTLQQHPARVPGVLGGAIKLDGHKDCVNFGPMAGLRLTGDMTLSAWINASAFPVDDASIVSSLKSVGCQLDTTVDRGPRTIGFKLTDENGQLMARYGATPLNLNTWYHVAGVYNAEAKTLHVYLNGQPDDGDLVGAVSALQRSSRQNVYVGRRSALTGFEFAGSIDDVRVYSIALTQPQILAVMRGADLDLSASSTVVDAAGSNVPQASHAKENEPIRASDPEDARIPPVAATLGVLTALACLGLRPSVRMPAGLFLSLGAGALLLLATRSNLPAFNGWLIPLTCLAGSVSVAVSVCPRASDLHPASTVTRHTVPPPH